MGLTLEYDNMVCYENALIMVKNTCTCLDVPVPIHSLIFQLVFFFFKLMEILMPEVESYLEGFMCELVCAIEICIV